MTAADGSSNVHLFYCPWYGSPATSGAPGSRAATPARRHRRRPLSVVDDTAYLEGEFDNHLIYHRDAEHGNRLAFHVFESLKFQDWSALDAVQDSAVKFDGQRAPAAR
ncbi:hypothetical protein NKH18_14320 [Streptomyces sp. M10(2022)]